MFRLRLRRALYSFFLPRRPQQESKLAAKPWRADVDHQGPCIGDLNLAKRVKRDPHMASATGKKPSAKNGAAARNVCLGPGRARADAADTRTWTGGTVFGGEGHFTFILSSEERGETGKQKKKKIEAHGSRLVAQGAALLLLLLLSLLSFPAHCAQCCRDDPC